MPVFAETKFRSSSSACSEDRGPGIGDDARSGSVNQQRGTAKCVSLNIQVPIGVVRRT